MTLTLRDALSILDRASKEAVATQEKAGADPLNRFSDWVYVPTHVEERLKEVLRKRDNEFDFLFLCGSSGDGKSALIKQCLKNDADLWRDRYDFHPDATHSEDPQKTNIEFLDGRFRQQTAKANPKPLDQPGHDVKLYRPGW